MARKPGVRTLKECVLKEYNHRCSVCGADRPQVHHIDENHENNDKLNLLPLCPNCHLSDQHNPTQRIMPDLLTLFRIHKDPAILSPQFRPLFDRFQHIAKSDSSIQFHVVVEKNDELVRFVSVLTMGTFYADEIRKLLVDSTHVSISEAYGSTTPSAIADREREKKKYLEDLRTSYVPIARLCVELLRYQNWPAPSKKGAPIASRER